ncbi:efflux transporter periplasmic adaptor subunit [Aliidiomarina iranensis]|uniref:Efflux transporter periplasmic adaptor subunit n=1 Tax=Aliidiomarina iranensis TaxID=1434071 RepID=A0A432W091_9GAMM|nr:efflux RND transporter periplasmic adaptor subunit [Aliidiomarina iranensis]RUO22436.1 efflux transporter periplasmic adaptor subunit [Aliidiomarina iranensis]
MKGKASATKRMIAMLLLTVIVFGLIFGYKAVGNYFMNDFFDNMPAPTVTITATEVSEQTWRASTTAVGSFRAVNGTDVAAQIGGVITSIQFANGAPVEQGDILVTLDTEVDEAERARLAAQLDIARTEAQRLIPLVASQNVSESDVARAESEVAQVAAALQAQDALIKQKTIRAPFSGTLGIRQINLGEYVGPGTPLVSLQSTDPIYLNFTLPEHRIGALNRGMEVIAGVDAYANENFVGEITALSPQVSETTRSIEVQASFANTNGKLLPGMFARVQLNTAEPREVIVVPRTAVQFNPFGNVVYVITGDSEDALQVQQRLVQTGAVQGDLVEVTEGLELGERIATSGLLKLRNNASVTINNDPDVQPPAEREPRPENR